MKWTGTDGTSLDSVNLLIVKYLLILFKFSHSIIDWTALSWNGGGGSKTFLDGSVDHIILGLYSKSTLIYILQSGLYCLVSEIRTLSCGVQGKQPGREETRVSYRMSKRVMSLHSGGFLLTEECAIMRVFVVFLFFLVQADYTTVLTVNYMFCSTSLCCSPTPSRDFENSSLEGRSRITWLGVCVVRCLPFSF